MTAPVLPDIPTEDFAGRTGTRRRGRVRYLPSAQVLDELAALGPSLAVLADDLRVCLSEPGEGRFAQP